MSCTSGSMSHAVRIRSALDLRLPARPGVRVHLVEDAADDPAGLPRRRVPNLALLPRMCLARATLLDPAANLVDEAVRPEEQLPDRVDEGRGRVELRVDELPSSKKMFFFSLPREVTCQGAPSNSSRGGRAITIPRIPRWPETAPDPTRGRGNAVPLFTLHTREVDWSRPPTIFNGSSLTLRRNPGGSHGSGTRRRRFINLLPGSSQRSRTLG
jgi:hypothetical protein